MRDGQPEEDPPNQGLSPGPVGREHPSAGKLPQDLRKMTCQFSKVANWSVHHSSSTSC